MTLRKHKEKKKKRKTKWMPASLPAHSDKANMVICSAAHVQYLSLETRCFKLNKKYCWGWNNYKKLKMGLSTLEGAGSKMY